jgi:hypothetical protein
MGAKISGAEKVYAAANYWVVRAASQIIDVIVPERFVGIGFGGSAPGDLKLGDLSNLSREEMRRRVESNPEVRNPDNSTEQLWRFIHEIKPGDFVLVPLNKMNGDVFHIGKVAGEYTYSPPLPLPHRRSVDWVRTNIPNATLNPKLTQKTVYSADRHRETIDRLVRESGGGRHIWDEFVRRAQQYVESGRLESEEIEYKAEIGRRLAAAREAVLAGADGWGSLVNAGLVNSNNNLIHYVQISKFHRWVNGSSDDALIAMRAIWAQDDSSVAKRVRDFADLFPSSVVRGLVPCPAIFDKYKKVYN